MTTIEAKGKLAGLAEEIRLNDYKVSDRVCIELHDMVWSPDLKDSDLKDQIQIIWRSSRCANADLVVMALELVAMYKTEERPAAPIEEIELITIRTTAQPERFNVMYGKTVIWFDLTYKQAQAAALEFSQTLARGNMVADIPASGFQKERKPMNTSKNKVKKLSVN